MTEPSLAALLLSLAIEFAKPGASPYSLIPLDDCGSDPLSATCELRPVCAEPRLACRPPFWSKSRAAWVRFESPTEARQRYATIAEVLARTANKLTACEEEKCEPIHWQGSPQLLALAALSVVLHESGLREDIQFGRPPRGRGPAGEACLMQLDVRDAPVLATWLDPKERERDKKSKDDRELFAQSLLGDSPEALGRCIEVGMRMLARARRSCGRAESWKHGMFSMYGTGTTCNASVLRDRTRTFKRLIARAQALQAAARPEPLMVN